jgi:hypothetical protein
MGAAPTAYGSVAIGACDNVAMDDFRKSLIKSTLRLILKRIHYPLEVMMTCVRWYAAYAA